MNLTELFDVSPAKVAELKARIMRLGIDAGRIEETFLKGGGKGGQKINKTANCVRLYYPLLNIGVRVQRNRRRTINRFLALRELVDRIEMKVSPGTSRRLQEIERIRRRKAKRRERAIKNRRAEHQGGRIS